MVNKKIIFSIVFSTSVPVFAGSVTIDPKNYMSYTQGKQNRSISYIGENKLVVWEEEDTVYVEQYDLKGNLIVSCKGSRKNNEITMSSNDTINTFNASDIVETISVNTLPSTYSFKKVATLQVFNNLTFDTQTMYLYEDPGRATHTTYTIRSYICVLLGDVLKISTTIVLAADKYTLKYYGQDRKTSKKSDIFSNTVKYIITDEESNKLNEVYYDGGAYYDPKDDSHTLALMQYIVPNLYGLDYEWYR